MSFLFGKKSKQPPASLPPATRDVHTSGGSRGPSGQQQPNGVNLKGQTPTPERSVNNSIGGANTPSPEHGPDQRGALDQESQVSGCRRHQAPMRLAPKAYGMTLTSSQSSMALDLPSLDPLLQSAQTMLHLILGRNGD